MSGTLGLKNSFRERVYEPLKLYRGNDGTGGREISLVDFMQTRALNEEGKPVGLKNTSGQPITWDDIWCELGQDPATLSLNNLLSLSGTDMQYLAPEIVRDFILKGLNTEASYLDLIASTESVDSMNVTVPWIKYLNEEMQPVGETETIPEAQIEWGHKSVTVSKDAIALHWSDELLLSVKLPMLRWFLQKVGVALGVKLYNRGIGVMINGDQADSSDSTAVVGVASQGTLAFKDFLRLWLRARQIGMRWESVINNETTAWSLLQLDEFSKPQGAGSVITTIDSRNRIIPGTMTQLLSSEMTDNQHLIFDKRFGMIFLSFRGLLVESERIIMRQLSGTAASIISGFTTIDRNARIILDSSKAFSGYGFPSYMAPLV